MPSNIEEFDLSAFLLKEEDIANFANSSFDSVREALYSRIDLIRESNERNAEQIVILKLKDRIDFLEWKLDHISRVAKSTR